MISARPGAGSSPPSRAENIIATTEISVRSVASRDANFAILVSLSVCHLLNDTNQSLLSAIYPILKG